MEIVSRYADRVGVFTGPILADGDPSMF